MVVSSKEKTRQGRKGKGEIHIGPWWKPKKRGKGEEEEEEAEEGEEDEEKKGMIKLICEN